MIDFRYHVVSIVAVFLALALGLFVGSTSLQDAVVHTINSKADRVSRANDSLRSQVGYLQGRVSADQRFDQALLPTAISGKLSGQLVTVVSAPGTDDGVRKQVLAAVDTAGGTVSADVRLHASLVDPKKSAFLSALTDRVHVSGRTDTASAGDAHARAAAQLAAVLGVRPSSRAVAPATVDTVLAAYTAADLVSATSPAASPRPGTLAIVLTGPPPATTADPAVTKTTQDFVVDLVRDLDAEALGAVVAGPARAADDPPGIVDGAAGVSGLLDDVSAVNAVDSAAGQIAAVYALAAQADGVAGRFGPGAPAPLPTGSAAP